MMKKIRFATREQKFLELVSEQRSMDNFGTNLDKEHKK